MCKIRGRLIQNVPKIRVICLISLSKVNIIIVDNDFSFNAKIQYSKYVHMLKEEIKHQNDLEFQWGFQGMV